MKEKFIYKVKTNDEGWDTYSGFVVIADNKDEARKLIEEKEMDINVGKIKKIGIALENAKSEIVLEDFIAG